MSKHAEATGQRIKQKEMRKSLFLEYMEKDPTIYRACESVGVVYETYRRWKAEDTDFALKVEQLKKGGRHEGGYDGSFVGFRREYLNMETYWHQYEIVKAIQSAESNRITQVLVPPEHGKTTLLTDYINYKLAIEPNTRITYVHEAQPFARKVVGQVQRRMLENEKYLLRFGPFYDESKPWRADYMTVANSTHDERDYSLEGRGITSSVQGVRTDLLLVDDVQSLRTLNLSESRVNSLRQDFFSRPGVHGKIVMVGTRVGPADVWETMWKDDDLYSLIDLVQLPAMDQEGNPLCPELWPKHALESKKKIVGEEAWWRNYQQQPLSSGMQTFTPEMIDSCKRDDYRIQQPIKGATTVLGVDPALGGGNSILAASLTDSHLLVVDNQIDYNLAREEDIFTRVGQFAARYRPSHVVIERDAMQKGMARSSTLKELSKRYKFQIVEHTTSQTKTDPILGVSSMASAFIHESIIFPWGDKQSEHRLKELIAQLLAWRPDIPTKLLTQDAVMSLWFAWKFWMERTPPDRSTMDKFRFKAMPAFTPRPSPYTSSRSYT